MSVFPRPVTSADVAARLGVSRSTVSLALSGSSRVSEPVKQRVREVSAEMGYRPLAAGRRLRTGRSGTVGVLLPSLGFEAFERIVSGVRLGLSGQGGDEEFAVLVGVTGNDAGEQHALSAVLDAHDFDALVLVAVADPSEATLRRFAGRLVALESRADGVPSVSYDLESAAASVVDHLGGLGHHRLVHLGVDSDKRVVQQFSEALRHGCAGRAVELTRVPAADWTSAAALAAVAPVLELPRAVRPTAVVCDDARMAVAVLAAARAARLAVPGDLSVVCGHLEDVTAMTQPSLTGLHRPAEALGQAGAAVVRRLVTDQPVEAPSPLACLLVEAGSTGPPPR